MKLFKSKDQRGIVSIMTVTFLALILVLITTGFVRTMNSNLRQALDNQLTTQAFYAAESGVNDALAILSQDPSFLNNLGNTNCTEVLSDMNGMLDPNRNVLDNSMSLQYTCVMVSDEVGEIKIDSSSGSGKLFQLKVKDNSAAMNKIRIHWAKSDQPGRRTNKTLPPATTAGWGVTTPPLLRVTLYYPTLSTTEKIGDVVVSNGNFSRENLIKNQRTFFLIPGSSGALGATNDANATNRDASLTLISCDTQTFTGPENVDIADYKCVADIDVLGWFENPGNIKEGLYIRVVPIYGDSDIAITAWGGSSRRDLVGAQYKIDATGRANDTYRRIEVRKNISYEYENLPEAVVNSVCKQFLVWPGGQLDESASSCSF